VTHSVEGYSVPSYKRPQRPLGPMHRSESPFAILPSHHFKPPYTLKPPDTRFRPPHRQDRRPLGHWPEMGFALDWRSRASHHTHSSELAPLCEIPDTVRARIDELPAHIARASWRLRKPASVILVAAGLFVLRGARVQILYKRPSFGEIHEDCEHEPSVTYRS
jgi:hypothetical protein